MNSLVRSSIAFFIARKTAISCLLEAGDQRSKMIKKNYLLLLIELGVLKALKGLSFFARNYLQIIRNDISTCLKLM